MDLLQLEHFLAVFDEGSFTRAAERVFRTQSAVSQSIKKLEEEMGTPLFIRGMHDMVLTEPGKVVLEYARRMITLRGETRQRIEALKNLTAGSISIGAHESAAVYLLPNPLRQFFRLFPNIKVGVYQSRLKDVPRQVLDGEIDLGFVKEVPGVRGLEAEEVHSDEMVLISSPQHPLTRWREASIADLGQERFVVRHQCSSTDQILGIFDHYHTPCRVIAELWSFENIKNFVRDRVGLAVVPGITVQYELAHKILAPIPVRALNLTRKTFMVYRDQGYLSEPTRELIKLMRELKDNSTRVVCESSPCDVSREIRLTPVAS